MLSITEFLIAYALGGDGAAEIDLHHDRTMTIVSRSGIETITRCGVCPKTPDPPCIGLRRLALPYAEHPAYRPEWSI